MTTHPGYRQDAPPSNTLTLAVVLPLLRRLRCGACRGKIKLDPPTYWPGYLYCVACGRQFNEVVAELAVRAPLTGEDMRPKRGRPWPSVDPNAPCIDCRAACRSTGKRVCSACSKRRYRAKQREGVGS